MEVTWKIVLKKVFQPMIGNQSDLMFGDVEMGRSEKSDSKEF